MKLNMIIDFFKQVQTNYNYLATNSSLLGSIKIVPQVSCKPGCSILFLI